MIVLDTNVLSALMRSTPDAVVVKWLNRQPADEVWLTSITVFEARFGLALLPKGRRRSGLERAFDRVLTEDLSNRVLVLDSMAAVTAAQLAADRQRAGRAVDLRNTLICRHRTSASRHDRDSQHPTLRGTRCFSSRSVGRLIDPSGDLRGSILTQRATGHEYPGLANAVEQ